MERPHKGMIDSELTCIAANIAAISLSSSISQWPHQNSILSMQLALLSWMVYRPHAAKEMTSKDSPSPCHETVPHSSSCSQPSPGLCSQFSRFDTHTFPSAQTPLRFPVNRQAFQSGNSSLQSFFLSASSSAHHSLSASLELSHIMVIDCYLSYPLELITVGNRTMRATPPKFLRSINHQPISFCPVGSGMSTSNS